MKIAYYYFISIFFLFSLKFNSQVTIGSLSKPVKGSILDLKAQEPDANNITAKGGLVLPRVELVDANELTFSDFSIADADNGGNQKLIHTGLTVYNVSEVDPFCKGIYSWNGEEWIPLKKCANGEFGTGPISVYPDTLYVPSGQDKRGITKMTFVVTWKNEKATLQLQNVENSALYNKVDYQPVDLSIYKAPVAIIELMPTSMAPEDVKDEKPGNPFKTNLSNYIFSVSDGSTTQTAFKPVIVNQTNKALTVEGKYLHKQKTIASPAVGESISVVSNIHSNAKWKVTNISSPEIVKGLQVDSKVVVLDETIFGSEREDDKANINPLQITLENPSGMSTSASVVLKDAENPPRFNDLTLSYYLCSPNASRTLFQWVEFLGFKGVKSKTDWLALATLEERTAADTAAGIDIPQEISGIAWHRDQDGNIFLSGSFVANDPLSNDNRWMITNLAATKYDPKRSDGTVVSATNPIFNVKSATVNAPYISYPADTGDNNNAQDKKNFNNDERIGLLYNWNAATMGRINSNVNEMTKDISKVQGICPYGWHLPSSLEYAQLVGITDIAGTNIIGEISKNYSIYSRIENNSPANIVGLAVKETCLNLGTDYAGQSNPISPTERVGFNFLYAGYSFATVLGGTFANFGTFGFIWTSSTASPKDGVKQSYGRNGYYSVSSNNIYTKAYSLDKKFSVRCKKDPPASSL
ncbi:hypothetical protein ETU08_08650 [Apibacter muscae]|uniref:FISUMP domain-containing protein n=1 Tax=Apibacter muscae TaxID=2509004 RepID=UPI0011AC4B24|nr:FISUMP domain-containing protein [Apibacter muscae]TWP28504.1 hypothetical protein ETU08_08650 [Apibacter muscae]